MSITSRPFGTTHDGRAVTAYTIENASGASVTVLDYGCILQSIKVADAKGELADVALGYDDVAGYEDNGGYLGATIGRFGNRIGGASFTLDGKTYNLFKNDKGNSLHGGEFGFNRKVWAAHAYRDRIIFTSVSTDGEENYPGNLRVKLIYEFNDDNVLTLEYFAETDAATPINLTNHCYFNLAGHNSGCICNHTISIKSEYITDTDAESIPHGTLMNVAGTVFDLRLPKRIGDGIDDAHQQIQWAGGYDHNFAPGEDKVMKLVAEARDPSSGRTLTCSTDQPGVQFYTGNFLEGAVGKGGAVYNKRFGFCLETQHYPNAINCPEYPSCVLRPGQLYHYTTKYAFGK